MAKTLIATLALLLLSLGQALAGWYHVENFEGTVGPEPLHLSLQFYDGFGSGITVEGSYYREADRKPIALYGSIKDKAVVLCAIADEKEFHRIIVMGRKTPLKTIGKCPLSLTLSETGANGTWLQKGVRQPVALKKVGVLDDTAEDQLTGKIGIPFWGQTDMQMFSGIYAKTEAGICMTTLQVIEKTSGRTAQTIDFDKSDCNAGMLMTPIYMNLERVKDGESETILVNMRDGQAGHSLDYRFNPEKRIFERLE